MEQYRVREGFYLHFNDGRGVVAPGSVIELDAEDAALHALRIEPVEQPKTTRKAKASE